MSSAQVTAASSPPRDRKRPRPAWAGWRELVTLPAACIVAWIFLVGLPAVAIAADVMSEHRLKAEYLFRLPRYIEWPAPAPDSTIKPDAPLIIGVVGSPEIEEDLLIIERDATTRHRKIVVRHLNQPSDGLDCDMVYLADPDRRTATSFLAPLRHSRTLTIGDGADFLSLGGAIRLQRRDNEIRIQIHLPNTTQAGFVVRSSLLRAADVIR